MFLFIHFYSQVLNECVFFGGTQVTCIAPAKTDSQKRSVSFPLSTVQENMVKGIGIRH